MEKLKYRLEEGEEILRNPTLKDLDKKEIIIAVVKKEVEKQPITEKELVEIVKETKSKKTNKKNK